MRHWALSAAIGVAALFSGSGSASAPQGSVSGRYVLNEGRSDNIFRAINGGLAGLSDFNRAPFLRKLRKATASYAIRISSTAGRFSIKYDAKPPIIVWIGGEPIQWKLEDGQLFDVSAKAAGEAVSLTFRTTDSERTIVYRRDGQQLVAETTFVSPLLTTPIRFKAIYNLAN